MVRGRTKKSSDAMLEPSFGLPDGVLWNILSFWPPQRPKTFSRAPTYTGPRPGWVFTTRAGRTGYWADGACGDQDGPNLHGSPNTWTQHVASYWAQRTPNTLGPPNQHEVLTAFADRSGLSAIADPEARREAAAQKADELAALFGY